jgi:hypothetical protein
MNSPFRTLQNYELFLYILIEQIPGIARSAIVFVRVGASMAKVSRELFLKMASDWLYANAWLLTGYHW